MKINLAKFLQAVALSGTLLLSPLHTAYAAEYVSVIKDGTNVRTGPGTDQPVYMELFKGYPLLVVEKRGEWLKISDYENDSGWIHSSMISNDSTVIVQGKGTVNMRSGPGTENAIVANIEGGVVLDLISRKDNWVKVKHVSGTEGWIYAPLLWP